MNDPDAPYQEVSRAIRSWLHEDRHEDASRMAGTVLTRVEATPQRRAGWPARRSPIVNKIIGFGLSAAAAVVALAVGAQLFGSTSNFGSDGEATPTIQPTADASPGFSRFTSAMHGISIDYPSDWEIRPATETWTGNPLSFDSAAADVIFDPALGDRRYVILASQDGRPNPADEQLDQQDLIGQSGVCDPEGGAGGGSLTVDGASAWGQTCAPGISAATSVEVAAVTTDSRRYLILFVASGESQSDHDFDLDAALETVELRPDASRNPDAFLPEGPHVVQDLGAVAGTALITVTIPASGWTPLESYGGLMKGPDEDLPQSALLLWSWPAGTTLTVYGDPCLWASNPHIPATTVDDFAAALAAQPSRDASDPVDVTVSGYVGKHVTLHVPEDVDASFSDCDQTVFASYGEGGGEPTRRHQGPGQIDEFWILDVDGHFVVLNAMYRADTPPELVEEMRNIAESATFELP
ncbi:MAG: hypothetical protein ABIW50_06815 [Candidatus Limnocylindria bacterium]